MTPEQFCYWLHGFFEIAGPNPKITEIQVKVIQDHLDLVFHKATPDRSKLTKDPKVTHDPQKVLEDEIKRLQRPFITTPYCAGGGEKIC